MIKEEQILEKIILLIKEIVQESWIDEMEITFETQFSEDIGLESIEMVQLAEKVQTTFGENVNLADWLSAMQMEQVVRLTVGDLTQYIKQCHT